MGSAIADSVALHAPHFPVSARCFAGIRFDLPQDEQIRMMAKIESPIKTLRNQYLVNAGTRQHVIANRVDAMKNVAGLRETIIPSRQAENQRRFCMSH